MCRIGPPPKRFGMRRLRRTVKCRWCWFSGNSILRRHCFPRAPLVARLGVVLRKPVKSIRLCCEQYSYGQCGAFMCVCVMVRVRVRFRVTVRVRVRGRVRVMVVCVFED